MEFNAINLAVIIVAAAILIGIAYAMYDNAVKQSEPYQQAADLRAYAESYSKLAASLQSRPELAAAISDLGKKFVEIAELLERKGTSTEPSTIYRVRRVLVCKTIVDDIVNRYCVLKYSEDQCLDARYRFVTEGCLSV
jgi:hypothetical protein